MSTVYAGEDRVGVVFENRGPVLVLDRDGTVTTQYLPPDDTIELRADEHALEGVVDYEIDAAITRLRAAGAKRKLSEKTLDALADAVREVEV